MLLGASGTYFPLQGMIMLKKSTGLLSVLALAAVIAAPLGAQAAPVKAPQAKPEAKPATQVKAPEQAKVQVEKKSYKLGSTVDETLGLTDLDGKKITFKDLRGKVVLVHFWSTQCPFEKVADPKFVELQKRWKDNKDVVMIAINANNSEIGDMPPADGYAAIKEQLKKEGLTGPVYADHGNKVADLFMAQTTPHCFVLDKKGTIVYQGALDDDPKGDKGEATKSYARDAVEATLAGKEVTVKESKSYGCGIKRVGA
jgi:thiol-disulfide isomerase/thioredoxin